MYPYLSNLNKQVCVVRIRTNDIYEYKVKVTDITEIEDDFPSSTICRYTGFQYSNETEKLSYRICYSDGIQDEQITILSFAETVLKKIINEYSGKLTAIQNDINLSEITTEDEIVEMFTLLKNALQKHFDKVNKNK